MELLGIAGFAFFFGWMLVSFYWLFSEFPEGLPVAERDGIQLFVFFGLTLGYLVLHLLSKHSSFNPFSLPVRIASVVLAVLLPIAALALYVGIPLPLPVLAAVNLCAGLAGALLTVCWLDVASRIRMKSTGRFTSLAFFGGGVLFVLAAVVPTLLQPVFGIIYAFVSVGLLSFAGDRADGNRDAPPLGACKDTWVFTKEIEPSLVAFGIVFGLTFVYLFNSGAEDVLVGLLFVLPGAGLVAVLAARGIAINITVMQRVLLCITVMACILIPFATEIVQLACAGLVVAAWAAFTSVNYAHVVAKSVERWDTPTFRQVPVRLAFSALGFLLGWGIATVTTLIYGAHSDAFMVVRLCMAFILVAVVMLFFPVERHHEAGAADETDAPAARTVTANMSEAELFERRCAGVAALYQLSPRETDILKFLAKGRNAAYIQNKLTISPHTVKSHIYSIYRKLDIHSQQKLMDFVEEFPVEDA